MQKSTAQRFGLSSQQTGGLSVNQMREMHRSAEAQARNDALILRSANRAPGERVSYQERLQERHAFSNGGVFDASLNRHSDEMVVEYARQTHTRSAAEVIAEVRKRTQRRNIP